MPWVWVWVWMEFERETACGFLANQGFADKPALLSLVYELMQRQRQRHGWFKALLSSFDQHCNSYFRTEYFQLFESACVAFAAMSQAQSRAGMQCWPNPIRQ